MEAINNILDWLECSVSKFNDKTAFSDTEGNSVTFSELKSKTELIGSYFIRKYSCSNKPIAILTERNINSIPAFLGVVYSGNFYVPIDATLPNDRIAAMLDIAKPVATVDCSDICHEISGHCIISFNECLTEDTVLPRVEIFSGAPLYGIYTSGSTGFPKLVLKNHSSIISFINNYVEMFGFSSDEIQGNQIPFYFDASTKDLFTTLKCGCTTHIISKKFFAQPGLLAKCLQDNSVTSIVWVPSALSMLSMFNVFPKFDFSLIKRVMFVGEAMPAKQLNNWYKALPNVQFINLYGSTENAGNCLYYRVNRSFADNERIPAGKAFPNTRVFLLGDDGEEIDPSNTFDSGEICVSGDTISLGYYNNPSATDEKIGKNPANNSWLELTMFSGDVGKYNENGDIVYLCRKDFQIKLNGYRIELGDIETSAYSCDGISSACCLFDEEKKKIILFYSANDISAEESLKMCLKSDLPAYMLPSKYIRMNELPLNANGKIHRTELRRAYDAGEYK